MAQIDQKIVDEQVLQHPYMQYMANANMTECYKEMLLAGDEKIIKFLPDKEHYNELRKSFVEDYPKVAKEFEKIKPSDCVIA